MELNIGITPFFAQTTSFFSDPFNHPLLPQYLAVAFVTVVLVLVIAVTVVLRRTMNFLLEDFEKRKAKEAGVAYVPRQTWWNRFAQKMNASVPVEEEKNIDLGHNYDGIRELDNHLPPWWKWLFYGTIAWGIVYLVLYHVSNSLPLSEAEYLTEIEKAETELREFQRKQPQEQIDVAALKYQHDTEILGRGKKVFADNNCGSCHREDGGGNAIGPNLTDAYWLHGGDVQKVFNTIKAGVVEKGMPAWGRSLSPAQVRDVTFFVMSLQGSNPPNAKPRQGDLVTPVTQSADSTSISSVQ